MGNRISGALRKPTVEERLTRPQRLLRQPSGVDYDKLRKLILARKLAPCFDALDEPPPHYHYLDLEECPICFFYYPCLNRSRCCSKGICTECFLQMKPSDANHPVQIAADRNFFIRKLSSDAQTVIGERCPFCKTSCYAVEYHGARSEEEKEQQQAEEQKVIEAKLRMQCESQNAMLAVPSCGEDVREMSDLRSTLMQENNGLDCSQHACNNRNRGLCVNLEEIMVMEAIWDSLQDFRSSKRGENRISGSSDIVRLESLTNRMDARTCSPSFSEVSSTDPQPLRVEVASSSLPEQNLLTSYSTKPNCERNQPVLNPHGSCSVESERRPSLIECLALPLDSDEEHLDEYTD